MDLRNAEEDFIKKVFEFYNTQKTFLIRDCDSFMPALTSKKRLPLAVLSEDKEIIAYFVVGTGDLAISEIFVKDETLFPDVIKSYMAETGTTKLFLGLPAYDPLAKQAYRVAERYHIMQPGNFKILNFKRVMESFVREKSLHEYMPDGRITIDSEVFGAWSIEKTGDKISVEPYADKAQYVLPGYTAYPFLFGPLTPQAFSGSYEDALLKSWFPLPLYCPYLT